MTRPRAAPSGRRVPPSVELFAKPTPLERLERLEAVLGDVGGPSGGRRPAAIWAKRDDLMTVGLGGNKLRNLEYLVAAARREVADTLITAGRGGANHCRLTAAAAARAGLSAVLIHPGPAPAVPGPGERLSRLFGADLRYAAGPSNEERDQCLERTVVELVAAGRRPYVVGVGASGPIGASGQVAAGVELVAQLRERGVAPDVIFVAAATGGTCTGIAVALAREGITADVVAVPSHLTSAASPAAFREYLGGLARDLAVAWGVAPADVSLPLEDDLARWETFGSRVPDAERAAELLARTEGIAADPVYTARTIKSLVAWSTAGRLTGRQVVIWFGGGIPALFDHASRSDEAA